jgi:hypothetical protein
VAASIRLDLAECLAESGRREAAAREVETARRTFEELGAGWGAERVVALVRRLRHGPPITGNGPFAALTPRELDVLALLSRGLTNADRGPPEVERAHGASSCDEHPAQVAAAVARRCRGAG